MSTGPSCPQPAVIPDAAAAGAGHARPMAVMRGERLGAIRRCELVDVMGERGVRTALASGVLEQPWRGILIRGESGCNSWTLASAALMSIGDEGVLSGLTALSLHGCSAADTLDVHVTVPRNSTRKSRGRLVLHRDDVPPSDIRDAAGLPMLAPDQALVDVLCGADPDVAIACLDQALRIVGPDGERRLGEEVHARLARRRDIRRTAAARMLLRIGSAKADSPQESRLRLLVVRAGFPVPTAQYEVHSVDGRLVYVLDLAWERYRIALEYDGYDAHEHRAGYDAERDERMRRRGWIVIRATASDLRDPTRLLAELRRSFDSRR